MIVCRFLRGGAIRLTEWVELGLGEFPAAGQTQFCARRKIETGIHSSVLRVGSIRFIAPRQP